MAFQPAPLFAVWQRTWAVQTLWSWAPWTDVVRLRALCRHARHALVPATLAHRGDGRLTLAQLAHLAPQTVRQLHLTTLVGPRYMALPPWDPLPQALVLFTTITHLVAADTGLVRALCPLRHLEVTETWALHCGDMHVPWPMWWEKALRQWPALETLRMGVPPHRDTSFPAIVHIVSTTRYSGPDSLYLPTALTAVAVSPYLHTVAVAAPPVYTLWAPWLRTLATLPRLRRLAWWVSRTLGHNPGRTHVAKAWADLELTQIKALDWGFLNILHMLPWGQVTPGLVELAGTWDAVPSPLVHPHAYPPTLETVHLRQLDEDGVTYITELSWADLQALPPSVTTFRAPAILDAATADMGESPWWARPWVHLNVRMQLPRPPSTWHSMRVHLTNICLDWEWVCIHRPGTLAVWDATWPALREIQFRGPDMCRGEVYNGRQRMCKALVDARVAGYLPRCHTWSGLHVRTPLDSDMWGPLATPAGVQAGPALMLADLHVTVYPTHWTGPVWTEVRTRWAPVHTIGVRLFGVGLHSPTVKWAHELCTRLAQPAPPLAGPRAVHVSILQSVRAPPTDVAQNQEVADTFRQCPQAPFFRLHVTIDNAAHEWDACTV